MFQSTEKFKDFNLAHTLVYKPCGLECSQPSAESESAAYGACTFVLNNFLIRFRVAKITPKKDGQFVTLWKRIGKSPIQPFDCADADDFFVVSVRQDYFLGQFVFPKSVFSEKGIVSKNGQGGKLAIRVYPPWDNPLSKEAQKTQKWQMEYFLTIDQSQPIDCSKVYALYGLVSK